jgi:HK97 family phage major capsid protein
MTITSTEITETAAATPAAPAIHFKDRDEFRTFVTDIVREIHGDEAAETREASIARGKEAGAGVPEPKSGVAKFLGALGAGEGERAASDLDRLAEADPETRHRHAQIRAALTIQALVTHSDVAPSQRAAAAAEYLSTTYKGSELAGQVVRALTAADTESAAILVGDQVANDIIELTRPLAVLSRLGARTIPLPSGELTIPSHVAGSTGGWIGEGDDIPLTQPEFGAITMRERTYGAIVPISKKLLRVADRTPVDSFVVTDLRNDIAVSLDTAGLRGSGVNAQPLGVRWQGVGAAEAGADIAGVTATLLGCFQAMGEAELAMLRLGWGMSWRTWAHLMGQRDGNSNLVWGDEMRGGTLMGQRYAQTSKIPDNLDPLATGTANKSELYFMDMEEVLEGRGQQIAIDMSEQAAYMTAGGQVRSSFQKYEMLVRAIVGYDVRIRRSGAVQVRYVTWGAA